MAGTLSYADFQQQCTSFVEKSSLFSDGWEKRSLKHGSCPDYIMKKTVTFSKEETLSKPEDVFEFEDSIQCVGHGDISEKTSEHLEQTILFEYQVLYSEIYNVPVLYFFASKSDGKTLTLEEIWNQVPSSYQHALCDKWSFITQTEHPSLGCPVFFIHPCNTAKMMENLTHSDQRTTTCRSGYLLTWLSAVGPVVGLKVSMEYFK